MKWSSLSPLALCLLLAACNAGLDGLVSNSGDTGAAGQSGTGGTDASAGGAGGNGGTGTAGGNGSTGAAGGNGGTGAAGGNGGTGAAGGNGGTGACKPGTKQCSGNGVETCSSSGAWSTAVPCAPATPQCSGAGLCGVPPSCQTSGSGLTDCGPGKESCCTSPLVKGGTFYRSYDGVTYTDKKHPAKVSDFRLDKYQITVGRFRKFVAVWDGGWRPKARAGKHAYLNGGKGLSDSSAPGSYEPGWSTSWSTQFAITKKAWDKNLSCWPSWQTWTSSVGANERQPINCVDWYEASAFCIWDGGFLPSEAEWNYAASGGSKQRVYPWSSPASSTVIDCSYANYSPTGTPCVSTNINDVGSESPKGDGRWGQTDLAGNVWDWTLDWYASYKACNNCAFLIPTNGNRVLRGGSFFYDEPYLLSSYRYTGASPSKRSNYGARCARTP